MTGRRRFYIASGPAVVGPYSKSEARIIKAVEPAAEVIPAPTAGLPVVAGLWLAFDAGTPETQARRRFAERYGHEPERALRTGPVLLVGPVGEGK